MQALLLRLQDTHTTSLNGLSVEFSRESSAGPLVATVSNAGLQAPWVFRGEVADALRAYLEGHLLAPAGDNGVVDLVGAWQAQAGARGLAGATVSGQHTSQPTAVREFKGTLPFMLTPPVPQDEPEVEADMSPEAQPRVAGDLPYRVDPAKITARIKGKKG